MNFSKSFVVYSFHLDYKAQKYLKIRGKVIEKRYRQSYLKEVRGAATSRGISAKFLRKLPTFVYFCCNFVFCKSNQSRIAKPDDHREVKRSSCLQTTSNHRLQHRSYRESFHFYISCLLYRWISSCPSRKFFSAKSTTMRERKILSAILLTSLTFLLMAQFTTSCNQMLCASIVSKCLLTQSCKCDLKNCTCCRDCYQCLSWLWQECCSCVGE